MTSFDETLDSKSLGLPSEPILDDFVSTVNQGNKTFILILILMYFLIDSRENLIEK